MTQTHETRIDESTAKGRKSYRASCSCGWTEDVRRVGSLDLAYGVALDLVSIHSPR